MISKYGAGRLQRRRKGVKSCLPWLLVGLIASPLYAQAPRVDHKPVGCIVAKQVSQLDAEVQPDVGLATSRVYFRSALGTDFYYVDMTRRDARFVGMLPRARLDARLVTYYLEFTWKDLGTQRTADISARVVRKAEDCRSDEPVAAIVPGPSPAVFALSGALAMPVGFVGGPGGLAGFAGSTAGAITLGAVGAAGVATVVVVSKGDEVASPSR
jgi:hypothetical protein